MLKLFGRNTGGILILFSTCNFKSYLLYFYHIIPTSFDDIHPYGYRDGGYAEAAIILNAYNGDFQEVGVFEKPFKYLTEEDAAHYAIDYLCLCGGKAEAQMVFEPSEQTSSRFLPVWKMKVSKRRWIFFKKTAYAFVNQEGLAFKEFTILPLGD